MYKDMFNDKAMEVKGCSKQLYIEKDMVLVDH